MKIEKIIATALKIKAKKIQLDLSDLNKLVAEFILLNTDRKLVEKTVDEVASSAYYYELNKIQEEKNRLTECLKGQQVRKSPLDL